LTNAKNGLILSRLVNQIWLISWEQQRMVLE
jgi:hypothetical protein